MRITTVRIIVQTLMIAFFALIIFVTTFTHLEQMPGLENWISKFLEIDPLIATATAISTHTLYRGLLFSLVLIIPSAILGRIFCGWICPMGIINHFSGWVFNQRNLRQRIASNEYRPMYRSKYYILIIMLVAAVFGSLQIGLLDPIATLHRSIATAIYPAAVEPMGLHRVHVWAWLIGFIFIFFVAMNLVIPRFFCRTLCPLGALLGVLGRFSLWRIHRDVDKCVDCGRCLKACEGACDPHSKLRKSECFVCFNCIEECPHDALKFRFLPDRRGAIPGPDTTRRGLFLAVVGGVLLYPFARLSGRTGKNFSAKAIRPPGSVEEKEFLERCIKCGQCMKVCPTNVLQPATTEEAGFEGLWTPVMNYRIGFCQRNCTACSQVCPTGAIQVITVDQKLGMDQYADAGPIRLGTAHYDVGRCLPWSKNEPCLVCEEVCPQSPKAIFSESRKLLVRDGKKQVVHATPTTVRVAEHPGPGQVVGDASFFKEGQFEGDQAASYHLEIVHRGGRRESYPILTHDHETIMIGQLDPATGDLVEGQQFDQLPARGEVAAIYVELGVPKIDVEYCIGCGLCEFHCPIVGDKRAVYVTAEGETRSEDYHDETRNRSFRLDK